MRLISKDELDLVNNLIAMTNGYKLPFVSDSALVIDCSCGCCSFYFEEIAGKAFDVISDWTWKNENNELNGIFLFLIDGKLGGVEVYSLESDDAITALPRINQLIVNGQEKIHK